MRSKRPWLWTLQCEINCDLLIYFPLKCYTEDNDKYHSHSIDHYEDDSNHRLECASNPWFSVSIVEMKMKLLERQEHVEYFEMYFRIISNLILNHN